VNARNYLARVAGLALTVIAALPLGALGVDGALDASGEEAQATKVVQRLQAALLDAMRQGDALGYRGRYRRLDPVISETHDLSAAVKLAVLRTWRTLDRDQRSALTQTFHDLSVATYAAHFHAYHQERFVIRRTWLRPKKQAVVESDLVKSSGKKVQFKYQLRKTGKGWQIWNIVVDGVSDLALKRADYGAVLKRVGFPALLAKLKAQIKAYEAGDSKR